MDQPDEGDPLVWLHKHCEAISEKYPTVEARSEYYRSIPPAEKIRARLKREIAEQKASEGVCENAGQPLPDGRGSDFHLD